MPFFPVTTLICFFVFFSQFCFCWRFCRFKPIFLTIFRFGPIYRLMEMFVQHSVSYRNFTIQHHQKKWICKINLPRLKATSMWWIFWIIWSIWNINKLTKLTPLHYNCPIITINIIRHTQGYIVRQYIWIYLHIYIMKP